MTRIVTTAAVTLIVIAALGCNSETGVSQQLPQRSSPYYQGNPSDPPLTVSATTSNEIDLVEKMATHRQEYRRSLEALVQYYNTAGNHQKMSWARQEMESLDRIPQYRYFVVAEMPENLRATERIPAADQLYAEAEKLRRDSGWVMPGPFKNEEILRTALDRYSQVITQYPTSDKIDDAAYRMAEIHDYFSDYTLAATAYQRAYQWDPATPFPARFKAAFVLDRKLHNRAEALKIYQEAIIRESQYTDYKLMAERRVQELNTSSDTTK
jgi:tetratricopeptide (TPR) repeat protein